MILIALATGYGLQQEIAAKTAVFNGHLTVSTFENNESNVSLQPIQLDKKVQEFITVLPEVHQLNGVSYKAALFKSKATFEGGMVKGVGADYTWDRLADYLREGRFPDYSHSENEILLSQTLAEQDNNVASQGSM